MEQPKNGEKAEGEFQSGRCKWFNVAKGWGFISPADGTPDVFVHQSVIQMSGFRSLGENEEVEFVAEKTLKGLEAVKVRSPNGGECKGSERRPATRKKFKKLRCYNCGEFANHLASKCVQGPMPKRCHNCKAEDHLIGDCPSLPTDHKQKSGEAPSTQKQQQPKPQQQQQPKVQQQQQQPKSEETAGEAKNEEKGNNKRNRPRPKKNVSNKTE